MTTHHTQKVKDDKYRELLISFSYSYEEDTNSWEIYISEILFEGRNITNLINHDKIVPELDVN